MINMPGSPEMMVILVIALIFLGPKELPKVMRTIGNAMAEVRKVSSGFQNEMKNAMDSLTDDGSKTSAPPKPQSGTMTAVNVPADEGGGDEEVVVRNTDPFRTGSVDDEAAPSSETTSASVSGPSVDPADRAAG